MMPERGTSRSGSGTPCAAAEAIVSELKCRADEMMKISENNCRPACAAYFIGVSGSSDDHLSGHPRMDRTEVLVGARGLELVGKHFVGVEHRRLEFLFGA